MQEFYSDITRTNTLKNNFLSMTDEEKKKKIKNFSFKNTYKILEELMKYNNQNITPFAQKLNLNHNRCKDCAIIMEHGFGWVEIKEFDHNVIINMTETGIEFLCNLRKVYSY